MAKLSNLLKSITDMSNDEYNQWAMDLRNSRRTPKIIHKKQTKSKSGKGGTRKPRAAKKITTRSGNKAVAGMMSKEQRDKLARELTGK